MADEATEFWNAFENETGEKVEARSIGEWLQDKGPSLWGLVILTDKSFRFKHLPSENWLMGLFKKSSISKAPADEEVDIVIPRGELEGELPERRGFFSRLTGPAFPRFTVKRAGGEKEYIFSVDPSSGFVAALKGALEAKR
jgi:hypothetical protein